MPLGVSVGVGDGVVVAVGIAVGEGVDEDVAVGDGVTVGVSVAVAVIVAVGESVVVGVAVGVALEVAVAVGVEGALQVRSSATEKIAPRSPVSASEAHNCQVPAAVCPTKPENVLNVDAWPSRLGEKRHTPFCWQTTWAADKPDPIASALACPASVKVTGKL